MRKVFLIFILLIVLAACSPVNLDEGASQAKSALMDFHAALNAGEYQQASSLYGGSYEILQDMNPGQDPADFPALWQSACTMNGFQCLMVKRVDSTEQINGDEFRFTIEYQNADGSTFELGPCCGESEIDSPRITRFTVKVNRINGQFKVMDLPPYVP